MRPSQRSSAARFVPAVTGRKLNYGTGTPPDADERAKRLRQSVKEHDAKDRAERRSKAAGNDHRQRFDPDRRIEAVDIEITDEVAK